MKTQPAPATDPRPRKSFVIVVCGLIVVAALAISRLAQAPQPTPEAEPGTSEAVTGDEDASAAVTPSGASVASTANTASASRDAKPKTKRSSRAARNSADADDVTAVDYGEFDPAAAEAELSVAAPNPAPAAAAEAEALAVNGALQAAQAALLLGQTPSSSGGDASLPQLGAAAEKAQVVRDPASPYQDVRLAFKLDPRLTSGLFMGERWVSPPTYIKAGEGQTCTLEATLRGVDTQGQPTDISATWTPADPALVTVAPGPGRTVQLTFHGAGRTSLEVASVGFAKRLPINAVAFGESLVVEVYQQ